MIINDMKDMIPSILEGINLLIWLIIRTLRATEGWPVRPAVPSRDPSLALRMTESGDTRRPEDAEIKGRHQAPCRREERCDEPEAPGFCKRSAAGSGIPPKRGMSRSDRGLKGQRPVRIKATEILSPLFVAGVGHDPTTSGL